MAKKTSKSASTAETLQLAIRRADATTCAPQHFGAWCIEPKWFRSAVDAIRAGTWKPSADLPDLGDDDDDGGDGDEPAYTVCGGVAVICIDGQMTKRGSSFGGCSTIKVRQALRAATEDWMVDAILLHICSPGGTVAGTADLVGDVNAARDVKAVYAYIADMGCSAAYWVASQCERISANVTAVVGSIGTYAVLEDDTAMSEQMGIKYRVVSTGEYKGLGADGAVSDKLVADVQREVDELNVPFLAAVTAGRGKKVADVATVADGRAHVAQQALELGLIDEVSTLDSVLAAITQRTSRMNAEAFNTYAAEHPEAVAKFIEQGKNAGTATAHKAEVDRMKAIAAVCPGRADLAIKSFVAGHDAEHAATLVAELDAEGKRIKADADASAKAQADAMAAKDKEIERLRLEVGTQAAVGTVRTAVSTATATESKDKPERPETRDPSELQKWAADAAAWEWANEEDPKKRYSTKDRYVAIRSRELLGQHKVKSN